MRFTEEQLSEIADLIIERGLSSDVLINIDKVFNSFGTQSMDSNEIFEVLVFYLENFRNINVNHIYAFCQTMYGFGWITIDQRLADENLFEYIETKSGSPSVSKEKVKSLSHEKLSNYKDKKLKYSFYINREKLNEFKVKKNLVNKIRDAEQKTIDGIAGQIDFIYNDNARVVMINDKQREAYFKRKKDYEKRSKESEERIKKIEKERDDQLQKIDDLKNKWLGNQVHKDIDRSSGSWTNVFLFLLPIAVIPSTLGFPLISLIIAIPLLFSALNLVFNFEHIFYYYSTKKQLLNNNNVKINLKGLSQKVHIGFDINHIFYGKQPETEVSRCYIDNKSGLWMLPAKNMKEVHEFTKCAIKNTLPFDKTENTLYSKEFLSE